MKQNWLQKNFRKEIVDPIVRKEQSFRANKLLSSKYVIFALMMLLNLALFFAGNFIINTLNNTWQTEVAGENPLENLGLAFSAANFFPIRLDKWIWYLVLFAIMAFITVRLVYKIRVAYRPLDEGLRELTRWTTRQELEEQFTHVPLCGERFNGMGGIPIAQDDTGHFIDPQAVNTAVIGITGSGKTQTVIIPMIDILSRASVQSSMIVTDPKLELAPMCYETLVQRGYDVHILNLVNLEYSMGYNPLELIIEKYESGDIGSAQLLANTLAHTIYSAKSQGGGSNEQFFTENAESLLCGFVLAQIADCIEKDRKENEDLQKALKERQDKFKNLSPEEQLKIRKLYCIREVLEEIEVEESRFFEKKLENFKKLTPKQQEITRKLLDMRDMYLTVKKKNPYHKIDEELAEYPSLPQSDEKRELLVITMIYEMHKDDYPFSQIAEYVGCTLDKVKRYLSLHKFDYAVAPNERMRYSMDITTPYKQRILKALQKKSLTVHNEEYEQLLEITQLYLIHKISHHPEAAYTHFSEEMDYKKMVSILQEDYFSYCLPEETLVKTRKYRKCLNLYSLINVFTALAGAWHQGGMTTALDDYFDARPEADPGKMVVNSVRVSGDKTKASIYSSMLTNLRDFLTELGAKLTAESTVDLVSIGFGKKPTAIFIAVPDYDRSMGSLATLFITQCYFANAKRCASEESGQCKIPIDFLCDEFGNMPAFDDMATKLTVCRSRRIRFTLVMQAYEQIKNLYPNDFNTIKGNCGNHIYIKSNDGETNKEFSEAIGNGRVTILNRSGKKLSTDKHITEMTEERPLITPEELKMLQAGETIVERVLSGLDKTGQPIKPYPIQNTKEYKLRYSYSYLEPWFPSRRTVEYLVQNVPAFQAETRSHVNMKDRMLNVEEMLEAISRQAEEKQSFDQREKALKEQADKRLRQETIKQIETMASDCKIRLSGQSVQGKTVQEILEALVQGCNSGKLSFQKDFFCIYQQFNLPQIPRKWERIGLSKTVRIVNNLDTEDDMLMRTLSERTVCAPKKEKTTALACSKEQNLTTGQKKKGVVVM